MDKYFRTDLACEVAERLKSIDGTEHTKKCTGRCTIESLTIKTDDAAKRLERALGTYVTVFTSKIWQLDDNELEEVANATAREIRSMLLHACSSEKINRELSVLVVGLGNSSITADAIGPMSIERLTVTRHIKSLAPEIFDQTGLCDIAAITPGVLGKTGIESSETVKAAIRTVAPDALIVIDALAAGSVDRLATTVQLSDTGINPGAGIGNLRTELSRKTLNIPVISIGVPTVVDSSTMVYDALLRSGIEEIPDEMKKYLDRGGAYYVTPKETDIISEKVSILISKAILSALVI